MEESWLNPCAEVESFVHFTQSLSVQSQLKWTESTGVDITKDRIVEIAAVHAHGDLRMSCGCFSTTVRVDPDILMTRGLEAFEVHGITNAERS